MIVFGIESGLSLLVAYGRPAIFFLTKLQGYPPINFTALTLRENILYVFYQYDAKLPNNDQIGGNEKIMYFSQGELDLDIEIPGEVKEVPQWLRNLILANGKSYNLWPGALMTSPGYVPFPWQFYDDIDYNYLLPTVEKTCDEKIIKQIRKHYSTLDKISLGKMFREMLYIPATAQAIMCMFQSFIRAPGIEDHAMLTYFLSIFDIIQEDKLVAFGNIGRTKNAVVIKKLSNKAEKSNELVISYALNSLRNEIPNFMYTFGHVICGKKSQWDDKIIMCNKLLDILAGRSYGKGIYVFYENAYGDYTMKRFVMMAKSIDILLVIIQVFAALHMAHKHCDFTHYDLHWDNIIVREYKEEKVLRYIINYGEIYIRTKYVAIIIDYGLSHAVVNNTHVGIHWGREFGIMHDKSFPYHDIRKFIMNGMLSRVRRLSYVFAELDKFLNISNKIDDTIIGGTTNYPPNIPHLFDIEYSDFLDFIFERFPDELDGYISSEPIEGLDELYCNNCPSIEDILSRFQMFGDNILSPSTIEAIYGIYNSDNVIVNMNILSYELDIVLYKSKLLEDIIETSNNKEFSITFFKNYNMLNRALHIFLYVSDSIYDEEVLGKISQLKINLEKIYVSFIEQFQKGEN